MMSKSDNNNIINNYYYYYEKLQLKLIKLCRCSSRKEIYL